jgi:hypothetical protein
MNVRLIRNVCLNSSVRGPVIGKTPWRGTGSLPTTPLITANWTYISVINYAACSVVRRKTTLQVFVDRHGCVSHAICVTFL